MKRITINGSTYSYAVTPLVTTIKFPSGKVVTANNWDVKGVRVRAYRDNLSDYEIETIKGQSLYGIKTEELVSFIQRRNVNDSCAAA